MNVQGLAVPVLSFSIETLVLPDPAQGVIVIGHSRPVFPGFDNFHRTLEPPGGLVKLPPEQGNSSELVIHRRGPRVRFHSWLVG